MKTKPTLITVAVALILIIPFANNAVGVDGGLGRPISGATEFKSLTPQPQRPGKDLIEILMLAIVVPGHAHRGWEQISHFRTIVTLSSLPVNLNGSRS